MGTERYGAQVIALNLRYEQRETMPTLTTLIPLTDSELKLLQTLIYQECGMHFDERRTHFLRDRLQRRLKASGLDSFYSYYRLLNSREGKHELHAPVSYTHLTLPTKR